PHPPPRRSGGPPGFPHPGRAAPIFSPQPTRTPTCCCRRRREGGARSRPSLLTPQASDRRAPLRAPPRQCDLAPMTLFGRHQGPTMRIALTTAALTLMPTAAFAHPGIGDAHGFVHGFAHPLGGLDHILAMVTVGIFAWQLGGRALWLVPAAFV